MAGRTIAVDGDRIAVAARIVRGDGQPKAYVDLEFPGAHETLKVSFEAKAFARMVHTLAEFVAAMEIRADS